MEVVDFTKFDEKQCDKRALLLSERRIDKASATVCSKDFDTEKKFTHEAFHGGSYFGKYADPGIEGSLLSHTAIVTKTVAEPRLVHKQSKVKVPDAYTKNGSAAHLLMFEVTD